MSEPGKHTFLFADVAGFTALTESHGDEAALQLMLSFCGDVDALLDDYEGERVKMLGDALMIRLADPLGGVKLALRITEGRMGEHGWPAVCVGLHHGRAIEHEGDWFGGAVNLAARLSGEARSGEVLLSSGTRELLGEPAGIRFRYFGDRRLRNVSKPIAVWAASRVLMEEGSSLELDPVCRMAVERSRAAAERQVGDQRFFFCSERCAGRFEHSPEDYLESLAEGTRAAGEPSAT